MDEQIRKIILENRPNLSKGSVNTYTSILKSLYNNAFGNEEFDVKNFDDVKHVLHVLEKVNPRTRKTVLSALLIITDKKEYRNRMLDDILTYNEEEAKQVKNEKQEESWIDVPEIKELYSKLEKESKYLYKKGDQFFYSVKDLQDIQNYIILSLLGGMYIPPRRSKDYVNFKIKNINIDEDNFLSKNKLIFNSYKTAKFYGKQIVNIPSSLNTILKKWIKINPTEYLLFDTHNNKLSNVKLNQRLNKLFGEKKVGVNQLRHTFLSDKYKNMIDDKKSMDKDFTDMGSSSAQFENYVKK